MSLNPPLREWRGKRVWLVGASTGIGRALAEQLHALGATVIVSARKMDALQAFADQHPGSIALPLDVSDGPAVKAAAEAALAAGPLDLVCYCAGHYHAMRATAIDLPDLLRHHEVNTVGALHVLAAITPAMVARGQGHISLVSSVAGFRGLPQSLAYGPTKAALINLAETLYLDLQPHGLGVSVINPGFVETPLTAQNEFHMPALITPETAAQAIVQGWARGEFDVHFPKRFTRLMKLLRLLPYPLYFAVVRRITGL
ncbi:MAG: SDR family NAD(P)-dependent oxidoreductase [Limnohabitans sp.]|jgi:NAD(P)-dependent dehydrogenase (short-subunit alcohol dehydrogenase family)|nr:MAG: SDR family NAD(P)-dependent oxidoreductase [Limnohabitans sp.]